MHEVSIINFIGKLQKAYDEKSIMQLRQLYFYKIKGV
jgi:hypothetical protein